MRVVAGTLRGRRLKTPEGRSIRPTTDRIREAIFNLLGPDLGACCALDAFAGTGALGIEALSRGVDRVTFVDKDPMAQALVRENLKRCGLEGLAELLRSDALGVLKQRGSEFGLIFLDPPYGQDLVLQALENLVKLKLMEGLRVVCECEAQLELPERVGRLRRIKQRRYGDTQVAIFEWQANVDS
ncbi:MAG: 16S rRNA (guanine(966)-N(2))-methyltransferase RsmD [Deltaproteobacteria bacterium]|nr:16S rRNA (guanine(966)-N(2))-methyltransferase RsmD [Deltaproteobacteria bacterium]